MPGVTRLEAIIANLVVMAASIKPCSTSFRHTAARWMRSKGVNPWEVKAQLGPSAPGMAVTELYVSHSPDYLANAVRLSMSFWHTCPLAYQKLASRMCGKC